MIDDPAPWTGEPRVILWFLMGTTPTLVRHNFYNNAFSQRALHQQQHFEYERGIVAWLEYVS